jgi:hypothetical protein
MSEADDVAAGIEAREGEEDHDLLTFTEARIRMDHEIKKTEQALADLQAAAASTDAIATTERRLQALRDSQVRIGNAQRDRKRFEDFFGNPAPERKD